MSQEIHVFEDKIELARYFGQILVDLTQDDGEKYVALSGGTTPQTIFDLLAEEFREAIQWEKLKLFWVDERCVPPNNDESNYRMTYTHLISKIGISDKNIFRIKGELSPEEALTEYIQVIKTQVPSKDGWPVFDLIVLGMGDDGHTASIFPYQIDLWKSPEICAIGNHPVTGQSRVTITGKVINSSSQIIFLVTGENKAEKIEQIISFDRNSSKYPAKMVDRSKTIWLLDEAAATLL